MTTTDRNAEVVWARDIAPEPRFPPETWGPWRLNTRTVELVYETSTHPRIRYAVDLERCRTSAEMLDWIMQVSGKLWADDAVLAGLVHALNGLLNPQGNLCPGGSSRQMKRVAIRDSVDRAAPYLSRSAAR